jgi:hypothetical protein
MPLIYGRDGQDRSIGLRFHEGLPSKHHAAFFGKLQAFRPGISLVLAELPMGAYLSDLAKAIFALAPERRTPWFLRPKRYSRRIRRALFKGKTPDWASDAYKLIRYVNLLELIPTFGAFITAPAHFFRRLPLIRRGKKGWYKTPLAFLSLMVLAAYSCIEFVYPHAARDLALGVLHWMLEHDHYGVLRLLGLIQSVIRHQRIATYLMLLIVCFLAPLWILPPCLVLGCVSWLLEEYRARRSDSVIIQASGLNPDITLTPLDVRVYWKMHPAPFAWGLFYWGLYALFVLSFFVAIIAQGPPRWYTHASILSIFLLISYYSTLALAIQFFLVRPYSALLRATSNPPTMRMHKADAHGLISVIRQIRSHMTPVSLSHPEKPEVWKVYAVEELCKQWSSYSSLIIQEISQNTRDNSELKTTLPQEQRQIFRRVITIDELREMITFLQPFEKNRGSLESVLRGLECLYDGKGIPASPVAATESIDLSPSPAA